MKRFTIAILFLIVFKPFGMSQNLPALGDIWKGKISADTSVVVLNNFYKMANVYLNNVHYLVTIDTKSENRVTGIMTRDEGFNVRGEKIIGKKLHEINTKSKGRLISGEGYFLPLTDG